MTVRHSPWGQDPSGFCGCDDCNASDESATHCDRCNRPLPHSPAELRACPSGRCGYTWVTADKELHECLFRHGDGWHLCDCGVRTSPVVVGEQGPELAYPPNDETNDADLIAFLERAASGETEEK